ncbi:zinc finger and BTB domain-containing protein 24-like isoform X2 [Eriocheir sinensis]|uniref:zinc finger and BTB domain-containing protein 24-like isoform X2 n=1 Tax=Eriocheir sinensis TaxID=95602 RepID=UPI0021CA28A8|nr:zinc finger and BTB domain-containing protein 24-like isoform X2 [Eriocheir sinensis]
MVDVWKQNEEDPPLDLRLMWTSHMEVLKKVMQTLRHKELFADATLICGEKQFAVHQFVLSTCSLYLENLFKSIPGEHPVLMLPDTPPKAMEKLLDFMYLGQADLTQDDFDQLLDLAEELRIIGLIQTNYDAENQRWSLSLDKDGRKDKVNASKDKGGATFDGTSKITSKKVSQDPSKGAMKKYTKAKTKESKKIKDKGENIVKKSIEIEDNTKDDQVTSCLLSCSECPFRALSASVMTQHKYKHSLGKPYKCPYCHVRHSVEELHIAHQKRIHPKSEVVVNKCINAGLGESEGSINSSSWTSECVSLSSCPSSIQQTCKNYKVAPSETPLTSACTEANDSNIAKVIPENYMSAVQTELTLQSLRQTKSKPLILPSPDCRILSALLQSPSRTQKTGKRHRDCIPHEDENTKRHCLRQSSTSTTVNISETSSETTHQKSVIGLKRNLRPRKR